MADREKISNSELVQRYEAGERNFQEAYLIGTNLEGAYLSDAKLIGAYLSGAYLSEANLSEANLSGAKLIGANLSRANLSRADLSRANLSRADLSGANLSRADLSGAYLIEANLIEANLSRADLSGVYLRGANLSRADLSRADLNKANLSRADLNKANLSGADLSETLLDTTQALATNFSNAILTKACIQNWNINSSTNLNGVICEYVYLKYNYETEEQQERRPHTGIFAPGDFTKLFQVSLETVDLIFRAGVNWKAVAYSLTNTQVVNEDTPLAVQSVENKENGTVIIRVKVPNNTNKGKVYDDFWQGYEFAQKALESQYQARLKDKDKEINRLFILFNQAQQQLGEVPKLMSDSKKQYTFHAPVGSVGNEGTQSNIAGENKGDQKSIQHNYAPEQRQNLAETAKEIQELLEQLSKTNPTTTATDKITVVAEAAKQIEERPVLKQRVVNALKSGGVEAFKEAIDHPLINILMATLDGWQEE